MKKKTLKALRESIKHWEENLEAAKARWFEGVLIGWSHCALCKLHNSRDSNKPDCEGCPVREESGYIHCVNTPYEEVESAMGLRGLYKRNRKPEKVVAACEKELEFLRSLLPENREKGE